MRRADLVDVGNNVDLYVANQENTELTGEVHIEDIPLSSMGHDLRLTFTSYIFCLELLLVLGCTCFTDSLFSFSRRLRLVLAD